MALKITGWVYTISMYRRCDMSKVLSLKVKDDVFESVERVTRRLRVPRNAYINDALEFYNRWNERGRLRRRLAEESVLVRKSSWQVLEEMEKLDESLPE
jgi:hypothetical protein